MGQYTGNLTEGTKALLQAYPAFRVDVYPTHRTVAFPKYVTDNTVKSATRRQDAERRPLDGRRPRRLPVPDPQDRQRGDVEPPGALQRAGLRGQVPQPERGCQRPRGAGHRGPERAGVPVLGRSKTDADTYWRLKLTYSGPARRAGEALLLVDPLDLGTKDRRAWSYLPGQRRVKVAPDLSHDTPNPGTAGATTFDDTFIFNGSMERYDFKLVGKKEMIVPYNDYQAVYQSKQDDLLKPNFLNPDLVRWELHRVWVVEATLKEGKRHVYSKRTFYLDEDSWSGWPATSTTRAASCGAPASPTWRRATTCPRPTPTCSATTTWCRACTR
jgi:hypothetical protein